MIDRRNFLKIIPILPAIGAAPLVSAQATRVAETDPTAAAMGYKHEAAKVDKTKYTRYAAGQNCANCQLYQGKPNEAWAGCPIFPGKQVAGQGWCNSWVKKA